MDPVRIGSLGTIRILVPEEWVPVASKLISRRTTVRSDDAPPWRPGTVIHVDFRRRRRRVARTSRKAHVETS
jgi:hypothetical protein